MTNKECVMFVLKRNHDGKFYHGSRNNGPDWRDYPRVYARLSDLKNSYNYWRGWGKVSISEATLLKVKLWSEEEIPLRDLYGVDLEEESYFV